MQSTRVTVPPSNEFVYDLYYTHNNLSDLDKEAVLTVEALCDELVCDQDIESSDRDLVYEDEDDSNDENNWRADYPDEDPRYYENAEEDYDYAEDMVDTNFLHVDGGGGGDDDGDLLAYWMGTRCKVDVASDDGEDEYEADDGDSSDSSDE
uniref:Transcription factor Iwr1 domain-containing protein n=1 Tax=Arion vulgaris TaxID=1028688 RepID=A0A0B7AF29_9EUPU